MSGIFRNLLTVIRALFGYRSRNTGACLSTHFFISPLDTGIATLKSDKYFQLAEAAQLDFVIRTGLISTMLRRSYSFVNASQMVKFSKPVRLFSRVCVQTEIVFADDKCAYFSHAFFVRGKRHGEVLVKMKFKQGALTVPPQQLLGRMDMLGNTKPAHLQSWDDALDALNLAGARAP
ncbi:thioesterase family protein [Undibacterium sp.]|uniref:thioesterase family protein n=1 Tax=Undibacterium sp. TaxID=1914977 RepID=UPI00374C9C87